MYKKGEYIVHGRSGVCKVVDITKLELSGADKDQKYYVLIPMKTPESKIFFPVDNDKIVTRPIMTKPQARKVLREIKNVKPVYIKNDRQREIFYKEAIASCDSMRIVEIIKTLHKRGDVRESQGKRMTYVDDRYLKEAKDILNNEMSLALDMEIDKVEDYILGYIK